MIGCFERTRYSRDYIKVLKWHAPKLPCWFRPDLAATERTTLQYKTDVYYTHLSWVARDLYYLEEHVLGKVEKKRTWKEQR